MPVKKELTEQFIYHLNELFRILEESGIDMEEYKEELTILRLINQIAPLVTQLDELIHNPGGEDGNK